MTNHQPAYAQQSGQPQRREPAYGPRVKHTRMPVHAGALLIIGGIIGLVWTTWDDILEGLVGNRYPPNEVFLVVSIGVTAVIFDILAIIGGTMAVRRKSWTFAMGGSILGIIGGIFSIPLVSMILAFIALILIVISRNEFKS